MRFRRKSTTVEGDPAAAGEDAPERGPGPWDVDDLGDDATERVDLGSLLLQGEPGRDLRLQVDEASGDVQSVVLAGSDGALDVRAFAASRHGDLWSEVRPRIAADMARRGGTATEQEGRFGPELACEVRVRTPDGAVGVQQSRVVGINGPRWMLRATFIGRPAVDAEAAVAWEEVLGRVVVRRGKNPVPPGEPLPIKLPENARRVDRPTADPKAALAQEQPAGRAQQPAPPAEQPAPPAAQPAPPAEQPSVPPEVQDADGDDRP